MRVLDLWLQFHKVDDVDHPDFKFWQMFAENGNGSQCLQRGDIAAAGHHHVRFRALVVAGPVPDANPPGAVFYCGIHRQPLGRLVFAGDHDVDVMAAPQAMVPDRQQAVGVGRQVYAHDIRLLVDHMIDKAGVLMGKAVVGLLPDMRGEQIIQRCDLPPPWQFAS